MGDDGRRWALQLLPVLLSLLLLPGAYAQEEKEKLAFEGLWVLDAGRIQVRVSETEVTHILSEGAELRIGDMTILCEAAVLWQKRTGNDEGGLGGLEEGSRIQPLALYAEGDVYLGRKKEALQARRLLYDFEARRGVVEDARLRLFAPGPGAGGAVYPDAPKWIRAPRTADALLVEEGRQRVPLLLRTKKLEMLGFEQFRARDAFLSTCQFHAPHFGMRVDRISVRRDPEKKQTQVEASEITLELLDVPVFYLPGLYWDTTWNEYLPSVSYSDSGRFGNTVEVEIGLFESRHLDVLLETDYLQKRGVGFGLDALWRTATMEGELDTYFIGDRGEDFGGIEPETRKRGRVRIQDRQKLPWEIQRDIELSYLSDRRFLSEYYEREFKQGKDQETLIHFKRAFPHEMAFLLGRYRLNEFQTQTEYLPRLSGESLRRPLGRIGPGDLLFDGRIEGAHLRRRFDEAVSRSDTRRILRFDSRGELLYRLPIGPVTLTPSFFGRFTAYQESRINRDAIERGTMGVAVEAGTSLWRAFDISIPAVGIEGLKHTLSPTITYLNVFFNTVDPVDLIFFDAVDTVQLHEVVLFNLSNRFQTRRGGEIVEWGELEVEIPFYPKPNRDNDGHAFGVMTVDGKLFPAAPLTIDAAFDYDIGRKRTTMWDVQLNLIAIEGLNFQVGQRFAEGLYNAVNAGATVDLVPKWSFGGALQYDFEREDFVGAQLMVRRKFHRWAVDFDLEFDFGEDDVRVGVDIRPLELIEGLLSETERSRNLSFY